MCLAGLTTLSWSSNLWVSLYQGGILVKGGSGSESSRSFFILWLVIYFPHGDHLQ